MLKNILKSTRLICSIYTSSFHTENGIHTRGMHTLEVNSSLKYISGNKRGMSSNTEAAKQHQSLTKETVANNNVNRDDPEHDDHHLNPLLKTMVPDSTQHIRMVDMVPGRGPPPEPPLDCCMSGCPSCLWINYAEELRDYYSDGDDRALKAIEQIESPSLKMFIKLELGYL